MEAFLYLILGVIVGFVVTTALCRRYHKKRVERMRRMELLSRDDEDADDQYSLEFPADFQ